MSLDLIKKQKANIAKEKRKVAQSDLFCHPLAYQPIPKGREGATKEEINKNRKKSALDSFCSLKNNVGKPICRRMAKEKFKISPDKDAAGMVHSGIRPFVSGKRGSHVSDIYLPNKSHPPKKNNNKLNSNNFLANDSTNSFLGYRGTAELRVKVVRQPGSPGNTLRDRLGDGESELPRYNQNDIYGLNGFKLNETTPPETSPQSRGGKDQAFSPSFEGEMKEGVDEEKKRIPSNFDPYGTTVKLSFVKNLEPVQVAVEEEEEEENATDYPSGESLKSDSPPPLNRGEEKIFPTSSSNIGSSLRLEPTRKEFTPSQQQSTGQVPDGVRNDNVISRERYTAPIPLKQQFGGTPIKPNVAEEEEEEPLNVLPDYQPVIDYSIPFAPDQKLVKEVFRSPEGRFRRKVKKVWENLQSLKTNFSRSDNVANIQFSANNEHGAAIKSTAESNQPAANNYSRLSDQFLSKSSVMPLQQPLNRFKKRLFTRRNSIARPPAFRQGKPGGRERWPFMRSENAKRSAAILAIGIIFALTIPIGAYVQKIIEAKNRIEISSEKALEDTNKAKDAILSAKPEEARHNFATAYNNFLTASVTLDEVGGVMLNVIKVLPGGRKIKSGENLLEAGKHLTSAGQIVSEAFDVFLGDQGALKKKLVSTDNLSTLKELTSYAPPERQDRAQTLTEAILVFQEKLGKAKEEMVLASGYIDKVNISDLPEDKRGEFIKLKDQLPEAISGIDAFSGYSNIILSVLGHGQPKQYLFLFQNNDEMRATGGFIGTYGIIKIEEGNISQLMIDGIYNPDGQLKERVIPPKPIQKMSATWSMHDANWWPDFPKSAEKVAWFYEKTGGPSVDGVITLTPKLMEDLLKVTGPINHEKYGVTITAENFVELTQQKVEKDYDKKLNRPKQILADLAPLVLEKIFSSPPEKWVQVLYYFSENLERRSAMMYFFDYNVQKNISDLGWSGEILDAPKDYLSVINTNISGQKTDKMIEQKITHISEIKEDGSIVDNVTITRTHNGGKEKYDWYNAVNSDWLRVYVPKGSELLHAEGYTREVDSEPVDYKKLGFIEDEMVVTEESGTNTDPYTGTRIYEDSGKTVFANWTYVSPGETLTIKYSYLLPWKLAFDDLKKPADSYSLLLQKQAGDENTTVASRVTGLENFESLYHYPGNLPLPEWTIDEKFDKDIFAGVVLAPKGTKLE